jgi:hypothetical protein
MKRYANYASDGRKGYRVGALFDNIVTTLRRSPHIHAVASRDDIELLLADERRNAEILLVRELRGASTSTISEKNNDRGTPVTRQG